MTTTPAILRRCFRGFLVALASALLLFPYFQHATQWPRDKKLGGFRPRTENFPALTPQAWLDGSFAATVDVWAREHVGIRGWVVALNRQIRYSGFGQTEPSPLRKRALVIGTPPVLYENILLVDALRPPQVPPEKMDYFAARLRRTQELLRQQGLAFLVVLAPNKALVYPETLPAWARNRVADTNTDYRAFIDALGRHEVPFLDSLALFRELRPQHPDLVPPHAIHWGHEGAWIAWQHAIPLINRQGLLPEIPVPATEEVVWDKPSSMNQELLGQLNIFAGPHLRTIPSAYPVAAPVPAEAEGSLRALVVGDSFGFTFIDAMARSRLCAEVQYWFYMKSAKGASPASFDSRERRGLPGISGLGVMPRTPENGQRMLAGKNLVVFVVTTFNIDKFSWGFDRLVEQLYGNPDAAAPAPEGFDEDVEVNLGD